jgi:hypothetical protein
MLYDLIRAPLHLALGYKLDYIYINWNLANFFALNNVNKT